MREATSNRRKPQSHWKPADYASAAKVVAALQAKVAGAAPQPLHPVIQEFKALVEQDPLVRMAMTAMIEQIPARYRHHHPRTLDQLFEQLNAVLGIAPAYLGPGASPEEAALVGSPFSALLVWTMGTPAGFAAYRDPRINGMFRKLLQVWSRFLDSEASTGVLDASPTGWFCPAALAQLQMDSYPFDPEAPHGGYTSWNQFFSRELKPGARPIQRPEDPLAVVAACDSRVYRIARGVRRQEPFWIKAQPYSLADMLDHHQVDAFVGGDVLQAFLDPFNYHRWHSPVAGRITEAFVKEGLYFSECPAEGEDGSDQDLSQAYITHVQTRALIFIDAGPDLGLVCIMPVGMVEISSCVLHPAIVPGAWVEKGQELGHFQFGGSTHCILFQPGVIRAFLPAEGDAIQVGQVIAFAHPGSCT
jgi:phosphatidylserine decarboxylase